MGVYVCVCVVGLCGCVWMCVVDICVYNGCVCVCACVCVCVYACMCRHASVVDVDVVCVYIWQMPLHNSLFTLLCEAESLTT